jgi:hypothetical protein
MAATATNRPPLAAADGGMDARVLRLQTGRVYARQCLRSVKSTLEARATR